MGTGVGLRLVLAAPDPATWRATHLEAHVGGDGHAPAVATVGLADLLDAGAAGMRAARARLVDEGSPPPTAATTLAAWFGGGAAAAVGFGLAAAGAGFLIDPAELRWHLHADGWPQRVELGATGTAVAASHPWVGRADVVVEGDADAVVRRTVDALVTALTPLVDACRAMAPVGRVGLWNEVADALGCTLSYQRRTPVDPAMAAVLAAAVDVPRAPWRARPRLGFATSRRLGQVHVAQKGGCCLAYLDVRDEPDEADEPRWCSTCRFRDSADSDARQVAWLERQAAAEPAMSG